MNLTTIKSRLAAITQGEWKADVDPDAEPGGQPYVYIEIPVEKAGPNAIKVLFNADWGTEADFDFIASAPQTIRELVEEVEKYQRLLREADLFAACLEEELPVGAFQRVKQRFFERGRELAPTEEKLPPINTNVDTTNLP